MDDYYELYHGHGDESIMSYAIRMRQLPRGHPARLSLDMYFDLMRAGIDEMKKQSAANVALLKAHNLEDYRVSLSVGKPEDGDPS
ncbi:hypothetical protein [Sphingomonas sp. RB1R13]|uniref:hypothetical protein n=1 Tax=Sphingomonas sp. RB1R13 TaxID=3096159 RepID=UPI002FCB435C